jgi:hypothetical protein
MLQISIQQLHTVPFFSLYRISFRKGEGKRINFKSKQCKSSWQLNQMRAIKQVYSEYYNKLKLIKLCVMEHAQFAPY